MRNRATKFLTTFLSVGLFYVLTTIGSPIYNETVFVPSHSKDRPKYDSLPKNHELDDANSEITPLNDNDTLEQQKK